MRNLPEENNKGSQDITHLKSGGVEKHSISIKHGIATESSIKILAKRDPRLAKKDYCSVKSACRDPRLSKKDYCSTQSTVTYPETSKDLSFQYDAGQINGELTDFNFQIQLEEEIFLALTNSVFPVVQKSSVAKKDVNFKDVLKVYGQKYNWGKPCYQIIKSKKTAGKFRAGFCTVVCNFNGQSTAGRGASVDEAKNEAAAVMISGFDKSLSVVI